MKESVFVKEIVDSINKTYGWAAHCPATPYGNAGFPDIIGCCSTYDAAMPFAFECKIVTRIPKRSTSQLLRYGFTQLQCDRIDKMIKHGYRCHGLVNVRPDDAYYVIPIATGSNFTYGEILDSETTYLPHIKKYGYWDLDWFFGGINDKR